MRKQIEGLRRGAAGLAALALMGAGLLGCDRTDPAPTPTPNSELPAAVAAVTLGKTLPTGTNLKEADVTVNGTSELKTVHVAVGEYDEEISCRTLQGIGSEMSFTVDGVTPDTALTLDLEEIHQRTDGHIAYTVYVNDREVYHRTYNPISDGANHCFFDVDAATVGSGSTLRVRIVNRSAQELRLRRVWATSDPEGRVTEQGLHKPLQVMLMLNEVPSDLDYSYLTSLVNSYKAEGVYEIGLCWEIQYMQWGKERTELYLDNVITASLVTGAPLYLGINSWWSGTPSGMDGKGGMWQDVEYHQITYDKQDRKGTGQWKLTTPNVWGNNPWLTMNSETFNNARETRIRETVAYLQKKTAEMAVKETPLPAIHIYTENEPIYWPINWNRYDFDSYPEGVGDFSPLVIAAAAADGITLDPTDGLSDEEAEWMFRNLHRYMVGTGSAMAEGCATNYITVRDGTVTYPEDQMSENAYTHSPLQAIYPTWNFRKRAYENHLLKSLHFGGEWGHELSSEDDTSIWSDSRTLDYILAYGSYADINCERGGMKNFDVLPQAYAYGLEGVVIYNVDAKNDSSAVKDSASAVSGLQTVRHYSAKALYTSDFSKKSAYSQNSTLTALNGLRWDGTAVVPKTASGGTLLYRITDAQALTEGLTVSAAAQLGDGGRIEILAGPTPTSLQSVGVFRTDEVLTAVDPSLYAGAAAYVQVRLYGESLSSTELSSVSLNRVSLYTYEPLSGPTDGSQYSGSALRMRHEWIAARADAERLFARYLEKTGGVADETYRKAYALYAENRYGECLKAMAAALSEQLPADFMVSGHGQLGKYPVEISVGSEARVSVHLTEASEERVCFTVTADRDTEITVSRLADKGSYSLTRGEDGSYTLTPGGEVAVQDGKASFTLTLSAERSVTYPTEFEARAVRGNSTQLFLQSQDTRVSGWSNQTELMVADDVRVFRGEDGTAQESLPASNISSLQYGDYLKIRLNDAQKVCEVYAWYGSVTGEVTAVREASVTGSLHNAFVTVRTAQGERTFEIGSECKLSFAGATGENIKLAKMGEIGLTVGQTVTVSYSPYEYSGRVRALSIS